MTTVAHAGVMELVDIPDLKSGEETASASSSLYTGTMNALSHEFSMMTKGLLNLRRQKRGMSDLRRPP